MKLVRNYELIRDYARDVSYYMTYKPSPLSVKDLFFGVPPSAVRRTLTATRR
jgi:hypothetical protein